MEQYPPKAIHTLRMSVASKMKPWSVSDFEVNRSHLTTFIREKVLPLLEDKECRRIVIRAPVKSGKREMVEYAAMRDSTTNSHRVHIFLSAWHRAADEDQRVELAKHNMAVFSINNSKKLNDCISWINAKLALSKEIVVHLDECDHGSGQKQMLSKIWPLIRDNEKITAILYSATPQEVLFSGEVDDEEYNAMIDEISEGHFIRYTPPPGYCGPQRFLNGNLVKEALPFFEKNGTGFVLSQQGKEIMGELRESLTTSPSRNIIVLRLSYAERGGKKDDRKKNKAIYQFLQNISSFPELQGVSITVDKGDDMGIRSPLFRTEKIEWSSRGYWEDRASGRPMLIIIDQTSSRSTEWVCHDRIFATHDFRNVIQFSTVSQAQERVNHYQQRYGGEFQRIRVYGHKNTFLLSADRIDYNCYLNSPWQAKKVDRRTAGDAVLFYIQSTSPGHARHPSYPMYMSSEEADRALQALGCYADVSVSARVAGRVKDKPIFTSVWRPSSPETWPTTLADWQRDPANTMPVAEGRRTMMHNPFIVAEAYRLQNGDWRGYHRGWSMGEERPLDYDTDIISRAGWGVTDGGRRKICYKDGVLGVAFCWRTGYERVNTLASVKSMYKAE